MKITTCLGIATVAAACILLALTGCDTDSTAASREIIVTLQDRSAHGARNIDPVGNDAAKPATYSLSGTGPDSFSLEDISGTTFTLQSLPVGQWSFEAKAYNLDGVALSRGTLDTLITASTNSLSIELDEMIGSGSLSVTCTWDPDQLYAAGDITFGLYDGAVIAAQQTVPVQLDTSEAVFAATDLPSGFYTLVVTLSCGNEPVAGFIETVRIIENVESAATRPLTIGVVANDNRFSVIDKTGTPVEGTISIDPLEVSAGSPATLTFTATELPVGVTADQLRYQWYEEGVLLENETAASHTIPSVAEGTIRYDVVVSLEAIGTLGSAGVLVSTPVVPSIVTNP